MNKLGKLGDAIAISNLKLSMTDSLTDCQGKTLVNKRNAHETERPRKHMTLEREKLSNNKKIKIKF